MTTYLEQVTINQDQILVGDTPIPGCIEANSIHVIKHGELKDHWTVQLTLVTGTKPTLGTGIDHNPYTGRVTAKGGEAQAWAEAITQTLCLPEGEALAAARALVDGDTDQCAAILKPALEDEIVPEDRRTLHS